MIGQPGSSVLYSGSGTDVVDTVQRLLQRQIDLGHGREAFERIIESIRHPG